MMRSLGVMKDKDCKKQGKTQRSKYEVRGTRYEVRGTKYLWLGHKKSLSLLKGFFNKYGSYLLSRIVVQYHRPWGT